MGLDYEGLIIRPPTEADSLILQVTVGCSHNKCAFCPAFKMKNFRLKELSTILKDIERLALCPLPIENVFLADGDALITPQKRLVPILEALREALPQLKRVALYGNVRSILRKSLEELKELREKGLSLVYMGLESGDDEVLSEMNKGVDSKGILEASRRVQASDLELSLTLIIGLGGKERGHSHALKTAELLNQINPTHARLLTLMVLENTPLHRKVEEGTFTLLTPMEAVGELRLLVENLNLSDSLFLSNHVSNYLPLWGYLPRDKDLILKVIDEVLASGDEKRLRPEFLRSL